MISDPPAVTQSESSDSHQMNLFDHESQAHFKVFETADIVKVSYSLSNNAGILLDLILSKIDPFKHDLGDSIYVVSFDECRKWLGGHARHDFTKVWKATI